MLKLFDTHTHFDVEDFDHDRLALAKKAYHSGVQALILIGIVAPRFKDLLATQQFLSKHKDVPTSYLAPGLHPFYIEQHQAKHLDELEHLLQSHPCVAIGEIGLDSFLAIHKTASIKQQQSTFFSRQLDMAKQYDKPVLLHIRKSHAETLQLLKKHHFNNGGIAHAFSGGVEEAKALVKLGFKIGVTGQVTNPHAKRLHQVIRALSVDDLVLETDCPDMTPLCCQIPGESKTRNTPANLPYVLDGLAQLLSLDKEKLAEKTWNNSLQCLNMTKNKTS